MSRILDALKRAEQERISGDRATLTPQATTVEVAALPPLPPVGPVSPPGTTAFNPAAGRVSAEQPSLSFDDIWNGCANPGWNLDTNLNVFVNVAAPHMASEQLRTLRSRLYQIREKQPLRTVLITSALPKEGKTFISNNLAQTIVREQGRKVLLIDADLRSSRLHLALGAQLSPGLSDYLNGNASELAVIQRGIPEHLCFIAGGSTAYNPAELLNNGKLKSLLERMAPIFDWVIIDSPPVLPVADSIFLASMCNAVLMVVRSGYTPLESAQRAAQELRQRNLAGVVLNGVDVRDTYNAYRYYYQSPQPQS